MGTVGDKQQFKGFSIGIYHLMVGVCAGCSGLVATGFLCVPKTRKEWKNDLDQHEGQGYDGFLLDGLLKREERRKNHRE
jgi:hypothetical protein